ncbi:hypothetical protein BJ875DRAFT_235729 [Amylocarpus encephaloides]|uniref:Uncharacterized protein n=1 Tax=Amylocarpus encephaloides TaxID=45428 RepID=A0A9P8C701_9HELO|nr:hypothetical protein BJ875DRAFT_235729 [Amylocarpus encephaloides]
MPTLEANLAGAALAIALVALFTALGQLLQQYFATADGYRRCQTSVMGEYGTRTYLRWRWREFRFETIYTVPEISMVGDGAPNRYEQVLLTGNNITRACSLVPLWSEGSDPSKSLDYRPTYITDMELENRRTQSWLSKGIKPKAFPHRAPGELVCWIPLLHWIHESTKLSLSMLKYKGDVINKPPYQVRLPAVVFRQKSWDFLPPDVVRPLAKSTLSDIAIIARRMGMKWKEFRPSDGTLRAEGHSHIITSTLVRSLGIVLHYTYTGQTQRLLQAQENLSRVPRARSAVFFEQEEIYIPRARADRLGCGVIRSEPRLRLPDFSLSTQSEIVTALVYLDATGKSSAALTRILKGNPEFRFRVGDIVAFTTAPIRFKGSVLVQVPAPSDNVHGVTVSAVARWEFRQCLRDYIAMKPGIEPESDIRRALRICEEIGSQFPAWYAKDEQTAYAEHWVVTRDVEYLDKLQRIIFEMTTTLSAYGRYLELLAAHIRVAMFCEDGETSMTRNWAPDYAADVRGYFKQLPLLIEELSKTGWTESDCVDAWCIMMLRGMCWGASHFFVPGERVPIQYFGSQLPVYIG